MHALLMQRVVRNAYERLIEAAPFQVFPSPKTMGFDLWRTVGEARHHSSTGYDWTELRRSIRDSEGGKRSTIVLRGFHGFHNACPMLHFGNPLESF